MRINSKAGSQVAEFEGGEPGEGLAIFFSQGSADSARYRFQVKADTGQGMYQVGEFYSSPPNATSPDGALSRMIASAVCPGARGWAVEVRCADIDIADETANIVLVSSHCCTAPVGVKRVGERYIYKAGTSFPGGTTITILPGQTISSWGAVASNGSDGSVVIDAGNTIDVPAGFSVGSEPVVPYIGRNTITFTNVAYFLELLESA